MLKNELFDNFSKLKISQFDFDPLPIKIKGSGRVNVKKEKDKKLNTVKPLARSNSARKVSEKPSEINKNLQPLTNNFINSDNNENLSKKTKNFRVGSGKRKPDPQPEAIPEKEKQPSFSKMTPKQISEKEFLEKYKKIQKVDRDKDIKFFECIGDNEISVEKINEIKNYRDQIKVRKFCNGIKSFHYLATSHYNNGKKHAKSFPLGIKLGLPYNRASFAILRDEMGFLQE